MALPLSPQTPDPRRRPGPAPRVVAAMQVARLQAYAARAGMVMAASVAVGALALAVLGRGEAAHVVWLALLTVVIGLRVLWSWAWRRALRADPMAGPITRSAADQRTAWPDTGPWLRRIRTITLAHGAVWGLLAWVGAVPGDADGVGTLILIQAGVGIAGMMLLQFDLAAALVFALLVVLPLGLRLALAAGPMPEVARVALTMVVLLCGCLYVVARRAEQARQSLVAARLAEADRRRETEQADTLLQRVFDHVGEGICIFDAQYRLLAVNARLTELVGLDDPALHVPGTPLRDWVLHLALRGEYGDVDPSAEVERRLADIARPERSIAQRTRADGRSIETRRTPLPEGGFAMVCVDVSERVASAAALFDNQRTLDLLLRNTDEGFWFIDNEQRTTDANRAMCHMLGLPREALLGRSIWEFVDAANADIFRRQVALRAQGQSGSYEIALTRADGRQVSCYNNATPIHDAQGRKIGAIGLFSDITVQKQAAAEAQRASQLLAQKSQVLETTLESLSQGVVSIDVDMRIHAWNRRALALLEVPESFFLAHPTLRELGQWQVAQGHFGPALERLEGVEERDGLRAYLAGDNAACKATEAFYRRTRADGTVIEVRTHFAADGGQVRTFTDVTAEVAAQLALRESEQRFRTMADAAPALIWMSGADAQATWFNQAWLQLRGHSMAQMLAESWTERVHPDDQAVCRVLFYDAFSGRKAYAVELRVATAAGGWAWVADHGIPRFDGHGAFEGFVSYGWDITARKQAEVALIAARDEAERANRAKSEFLSRMSHELRTPLNAILGFGQLLQRDRDEPLRPEQALRVDQILQGGHHLLALINEVLDLARIEAGTLPLSLEPVDVDELVDECLRLMQPTARAQGVQMQRVSPPASAGLALADRTRLRQVLLNLVSNAIKYNRAGGAVQLRCHRADDAVHIEVADDGPGLDEAQQQRLFRAFERLDAAGSSIEGAGIGLALSKSLVGLMQGQIGVHSAPGTGSCFWVTLQPAAVAGAGALPASAAPATAATAVVPPDPAPVEACRVLYIEDNAVNQLLMQGMLAHRPGTALTLADLPEPGLALARSLQPDLILLDIQLPGMSGYEVLRALRADERTRSIPVIAVSANAMSDDLAQARAAGFDDYLTKPLDLARLLDAMAGAMARAIAVKV
ncbi:MAG: PAS-domain containing protein [Rubrivivax sp.]|nr:PAS-domain containing protein [Rubrivivax sp.]